ncbi:ABC transporter ATP-binding protein [Mesomycoplasma hyorhinis]|uniref:ABC transporter ATP-binding protein n=4 Tax=Mesomycoplasma hyorhinis TaxID=2100 RepID=A0ABD6IDZ9_MESHY|nr:ABC transporter ATP-binding protein [Mesomycoplasma hyorhinis]AEC45962.1 ABC-type multidrug-like transport system ATP-binding protein [Mesomycoplasma hyorhinis MCLD]AEX13838.1 ABC transporter, ATP-binding protein [Mesomycoplasma hyorhinis GDL-1]AFX73962.1 ABC transporter ATP binding protein [Mesomycoplasma hyorhinis SK76]AHA40785.1 ABC transporter ATP-binding protein [Mesomycoplasma hyorhinis DBS 1050]AOD25040.1 ABC transporter, ATP-binding protein [Mesomycoplasma hyorhinis]
MKSKWMLKVKNLKVNLKLKKAIVNKINFLVAHNEIHALIGDNGSGKSSIIKAIVDSYTNYTGEIFINNVNSRLANSKKHIGYVPDVLDFPREMSTHKYLLLLGKISNLPIETIEKRIDKFLAIFKIEHLKQQKPYYFSPGQKRKISLIQALIHNPSFVILDEPLSRLDYTSKLDVVYMLKQLKHQGKTILISTNNLEEMEELVDSVTFINEGKIIYSGKKEQRLDHFFINKNILKYEQEIANDEEN